MYNFRKKVCGIVLIQLVTVMILLYVVCIWHEQTSSLAAQITSLKKIALSDEAINTTKPRRGGFLISLGFWEQQTQGLFNFHHLQCLANLTGMRVVEPFLIGTKFIGYPPTKDAQELNTVYNMDIWNKKLSTLHNYKPVLSWETFKTEAPKKIIIHCIQYRQLEMKTRNFKGFQNGCSENCYNQFNSILKLLQEEGFQEVRRSCTNVFHLSLKEKITFDEFKENIFSNCDPSKFTIILNEFRGIESKSGIGLRFPLHLDSKCAPSRYLPQDIIMPSAQTMKDAEKYYRKGSENFTIAIMARIEKIHTNPHQKISNCIQKAEQIRYNLYKSHGLTKVFLAMDVGKYGTTSIYGFRVRSDGQTLFKSLYSHLTFQEWERQLSNISSSNNPAYVGNLQRTIAAKAKCLILIGGGSFQEMGKHWHHHFHPEQSEQCVYKVCYN